MKNPKKLVELGISHYHTGNYKEALNFYKKAIPYLYYNDLGILYYNMGLCYLSLYSYDNAERLFKKSFYEYDYKSSGYELALSYLFNNKLNEGLSLYQYRYYGDRFKFPRLPITQFTNIEQLKNKNVLVLNEQGFGDEILFSRVLPTLDTIVNNCHYQIYPEMFTLFQNNFKLNNITLFQERQFDLKFIQQFDGWIASGDLFSSYTLNYGTRHYTFNNTTNKSNIKKIGIVWKTNAISPNSNLRSISLEKIKKQLSFNTIEYHNLQKDENIDWMIKHTINNFQDTTSIINEMDLIISVDTSTVHLSASMNKPTLLIYDTYLDWRWKYNFYSTITPVQIDNLINEINKIIKNN